MSAVKSSDFKKWLFVLVLGLALIALAGCGASDAEACKVECDIGAESYSIEISCESGPTTVRSIDEKVAWQYKDGKRTGTTIYVNQERTYENTQNMYKIAGTIQVNYNLIRDTISNDIVVTGGVFGDTPQTCQP